MTDAEMVDLVARRVAIEHCPAGPCFQYTPCECGCTIVARSIIDQLRPLLEATGIEMAAAHAARMADKRFDCANEHSSVSYGFQGDALGDCADELRALARKHATETGKA